MAVSLLMANAGTVNIPYMDPNGLCKTFQITVSEGNSNRRTGAGPIVLCISFLFSEP